MFGCQSNLDSTFYENIETVEGFLILYDNLSRLDIFGRADGVDIQQILITGG
jgi:hypothetical protein